MKEVKKCSISGVAFTMDTDAYETLNAYLESLKATYKDTADGPEIVADIEARIAELILSTQNNGRVVEKPVVDNIIDQMGSAEDIADQDADGAPTANSRFPRRLYRDTENAKLGGVCAGIGKYFDVDPVWVRLGIFVPILITCLKWIPIFYWVGPMFGNLFGIFLICYFIMWFAVPAARTARQKLEMNGERINEQSIRATTTSAASNDADSKAKPIVAEVVSVLGQIVVILLKIFAGLIVFGLILAACVLIIAIFAMGVGGEEFFSPAVLDIPVTPWLTCFGIFIALIPVILLIYVLMCLIASRKPSGKTVLVIFLLWLASIICTSVIAMREKVVERITSKRTTVEEVMNTHILINGDTTTVERLLQENNTERITEDGDKTLHISVPDKDINISFRKDEASLIVDENGKKSSVKVSVSQDKDSVSESTQGANP